MKNSNYRLIIKKSDDHQYYFIQQKIKYFFGLFHSWDLLEITTNFKSEEEAKRFLKQLEIKNAKFNDKTYNENVFYYDFHNDQIIDG